MKWITNTCLRRSCIIAILVLLTIHENFAAVVVGHRGARGLLPEGTLPSYEAAIKLGVDYIDMDVVMTKDHHFVVYHDLALNPDITRDAKGNWIKKPILIKGLTLQEVQTFNVGAINPKSTYYQLFKSQRSLKKAHIPTLKEVILFANHLNKNIKFQIEIKTDPAHPNDSFPSHVIAKELTALLHTLKINDKVRIQAFDWRCLYAIQAENPRLPTAYLTSNEQEIMMHEKNKTIAGLWTGGKLLKNYHHSIPDMIKALGGSAWDPEPQTLTLQNRNRAAALGLAVFVWFNASKTLDERRELKRVLDLHVDGVISDRPDIARSEIMKQPS